MTKYNVDEYQGVTFIPPLDAESNVKLPSSDPARGLPGRRFTVALILVCYVAVGVSALACVHSLTGWLVLGLSPILLLDRLTFRFFSATGPESRPVQISIRSAYLVLGFYGIQFFQPETVSPREAFYVGGVLSLASFLFEYSIEWAYWLVSRIRGGRPFTAKSRPANVVALALLIAIPLVVLHPLMILHPIRRTPTKTPQRLGIDYREIILQTSDRLSLSAWFIPADEPRGTVVYCHGFGENRGQVISVLKPLHDMRLNVLAFDFRGHGGSPGHTVTFGHREVRDLKAACDAARRLGEGKPLFIVGVSYGAAVTLQTLPELPDVKGAWVDSTFARFDQMLGKSYAFVPQIFRDAVVSVTSTLVWLDCGFSTSQINPIESVKGLQTPICFCHSKSDPYTDFEEGKAIYDAYAGPKWSFWINDSSSQSLSKSAQLRYFRRLRKFLEQRLAEVSASEGA